MTLSVGGWSTTPVAGAVSSTGESTISPSSASSSETGFRSGGGVEEGVETFVDTSESDIMDAFVSSSASATGLGSMGTLVGTGREEGENTPVGRTALLVCENTDAEEGILEGSVKFSNTGKRQVPWLKCSSPDSPCDSSITMSSVAAGGMAFGVSSNLMTAASERPAVANSLGSVEGGWVSPLSDGRF